jgi:hypothetical protein
MGKLGFSIFPGIFTTINIVVSRVAIRITHD